MQRSEFEKKPILDHWSKMVIVTGKPGNRSDMVGGWLADNNYRKFVPVNWSIDPIWGNSTMRHSWNWIGIDPHSSNTQQRQQIKSVIRDIFREQYRVDARWAVTKSHFTSPTLIEFIPEELRQHFIILDILVDDFESVAQVEWEGFVKNLLRLFSSPDAFDRDMAEQNLRNNLGGIVDTAGKTVEELFAMKYQFMSTLIAQKSIPRKDWYNTSDPNLPVRAVGLDYRELMSPRGPFILSEALGLQLDRTEWEPAVEMARSKDRYWYQGRWWERPRCE